jgi:uncharacterized protein YndB with AHSA1/START domain
VLPGSDVGTEILLEEEYPHPPERVWRALTEPSEIRQWLMRADDFVPTVGHRFRFVAKPQRGWRGFVDCEVLVCEPQRKLSYSWVGNEGQKPMVVTWTLESTGRGTRLTLHHTGFSGLGGWFLAKLMLGPGWKKMLKKRLPTVLSYAAPGGLAECHTS